MTTLREKILSSKLKQEKIHIPEWGADIIVKEQTGAQRADIERLSLQFQEDERIYRKIKALVIIHGVCDEEGTPLFTEKDIDKVGNLSGPVLEKIESAIAKLNLAQDKDIHKTAKKSTASQGS